MIYTNISPHKAKRTHSIDRLTPHCIVGLWTAKQGADYFATTLRDCSSNYVIGVNGDIAVSVPEEYRAFTSSSASNDNRAITVECASDKTSPYKFPYATYMKLVDFTVDLCIRYKKKKLIYIPNGKDYEPKPDEMQLTLHRFFAKKSCPGDWFVYMIPDFLSRVNFALGGANVNNTEFIKTLEKLVRKYNYQFGFSNVSVPIAQCILESNWGTSELAVNAHNYFGLKHRDGRCPSSIGVYYKIGSEQNPDGSYISSAMKWEKFYSLEDSVKGYYEFLSNEPSGRYNNLKGVISPDVYVRLIKDDGYATSHEYVNNILRVIDENDLRKLDNLSSQTEINLDTLRILKENINKLFSELGV